MDCASIMCSRPLAARITKIPETLVSNHDQPLFDENSWPVSFMAKSKDAPIVFAADNCLPSDSKVSQKEPPQKKRGRKPKARRPPRPPNSFMCARHHLSMIAGCKVKTLAEKSVFIGKVSIEVRITTRKLLIFKIWKSERYHYLKRFYLYIAFLAGQAHQKRYPNYKYQPISKRKRSEVADNDDSNRSFVSIEGSPKKLSSAKQVDHEVAYSVDDCDSSRKRQIIKQDDNKTGHPFSHEHVKSDEKLSQHFFCNQTSTSYFCSGYFEPIEMLGAAAELNFLDSFLTFRDLNSFEGITNALEDQQNSLSWSNPFWNTEYSKKQQTISPDELLMQEYGDTYLLEKPEYWDGILSPFEIITAEF